MVTSTPESVLRTLRLFGKYFISTGCTLHCLNNILKRNLDSSQYYRLQIRSLQVNGDVTLSLYDHVGEDEEEEEADNADPGVGVGRLGGGGGQAGVQQ